MRLCSFITFRTILRTSPSRSVEVSSWSANWARSLRRRWCSSMMLGPEMEMAEPSIRNSNLLPVKAKGEVRFRSVVSMRRIGQHVHARFAASFRLDAGVGLTPSQWRPTRRPARRPGTWKRWHGGASLAPRRWSLPAEATEMRSRSWYSSTALDDGGTENSRNWVFSCRVLAGVQQVFARCRWKRTSCCACREPLTPSKGFSLQQADQAVAAQPPSSWFPWSAGCGRRQCWWW